MRPTKLLEWTPIKHVERARKNLQGRKGYTSRKIHVHVTDLEL